MTRQWPPVFSLNETSHFPVCPPYPLINLRGFPDTCRGACCSQGPRQRAAGGIDRTAGGYTWVKTSGLKMRGTTRLSHRHLRVKSTLQQLIVAVWQYEEHNYNLLVLEKPNGSGLFNAGKPGGAISWYTQCPYRPSA